MKHSARLLSALLFSAIFSASAEPSRFPEDEQICRIAFDESGFGDQYGFAQLVKAPANPKFEQDGTGGKAWLVRNNEAVVFKPGVPLLKGAGALSFWIAPKSWIKRETAEERGYLFFLRASFGKGNFVMERQGFSGKSGRKDYFLTLVTKAMNPTPLVVSTSTEHWADDEWHLAAVNWDENGFGVSIDGGKFLFRKYNRHLTEEDFPESCTFTLSGGSAAEQTLLDDFRVYKRNLTQPEVQQIFKERIKLSAGAKTETKPEGELLSWDAKTMKSNAVFPMIPEGKQPVIDGEIGEDEWKYALKTVGSYEDSLRLDGRDCVSYWNSDGKNIYFAIRSELPPDGKLITNHPFKPADNNAVGYDDSVEYWIAPDKDAGRKIYAGQLNFNGGFYDFCYDTKTKKFDKNWNSGAAVKSKIVGNEWHLEASIPLKSLGNAGIRDKAVWGLRLVRNFKRPEKQADWSPLSGAFVNTETMGSVQWDRNAPLIRGVSLAGTDGKGVLIRFEAFNPTEKNIPLQISGFWENAGNASNIIRKKLELAPGKNEKIILVQSPSSRGEYQIIFLADSADGKTNYYRRKFIWNSSGKETAWNVKNSESGADFKFGYYPYTRQIRTGLDISGYARKNSVVSASAILCDSQGKTILTQKYPPFRNSLTEMLFSVPKLQNGEYTIKASVRDSSGNDTVLERGTFEHRSFPWEHNTLGISDEVIPPYTPLKRTGNVVEAVLRKYFLNGLGLPEQIRSAGRDILSGPVHFRISVNGKKQTVRSGKLNFTKEKPNEIHYLTDWTAGSMKGRTKAFFDYDGMLKLTVDFALPATDELTCFDLVIPVKKESVRLMHVLSDTGKASFTSAVPSGKNPVWESMFIDHNSSLEVDNKVNRFPGTFIPYIWVGDENRGICWFADNDKDWLPDDKHSAAEVNRYSDRAEIVIRFVTRPSKIKRTHSITFALQATPTKPMPEKPVHWRKMTFGLPAIDGCFRVAILGSAFHWGGEDYFAFSPRGKDETVFRLLKETRDGKYPQEAIDEWIRGYDSATPFLPTLLRSFKNGVNMLKSSPQTVIPYTNMRGVSDREEEFRIFKDEWLMGDYAPKKWRRFSGGFGYAGLAARSRQDYILWCLNRMLLSGAIDGIYFDVTYPKASRNIVTGNAYFDENGKLRTGCDLFESRELLKRCAVLTWQNRGYNLNMAHMSFTLIAPLHTWAGSILDWEARYGMSDFQDRFSKEYVRTLSLGTQTGCVPVVLGSLGITGKGDRLKVQRTLIGMILTHEIKDWALGWGKNSLYEKVMRHLYEFGYGEPDCKVFRDWDSDFPFIIKGVDYSALALSGNGKMLLIICDYGKGGRTEVTLKPGSGLKGIFQCSDNTAVTPIKNGCAFELPKNDFRILTVE